MFCQAATRVVTSTAARVATTLVAAFAAGASLVAAPDEPGEPFLVGFTTSMFAAVNTIDARAAMSVWAKELAASSGLHLHASTTILGGADEARQAIDERRVHLLLLSTEQYYRMQRPAFGEVLYGLRGNRQREEYLLLTKKGAYPTLQHLGGKVITTIDGIDHDMSVAWLETLLMEQRLPPARVHFGTVTRAAKPARAVLPVYFGQADACVVTRSAFEVMVELNPQVATALAPLATSPPLIHAILVLDRRYPADVRVRLLDALQNLHTTARGQQVLSFFGVDRITTGRLDDLAPSLDLVRSLDRQQTLQKSTPPGPVTPVRGGAR